MDTPQTPHMTSQTLHKEKLQQQQRYRFGMTRRKITRLGLKLVLFARNLALNSDAVPNYKYMFGQHMRHLPHLRHITAEYIYQ